MLVILKVEGKKNFDLPNYIVRSYPWLEHDKPMILAERLTDWEPCGTVDTVCIKEVWLC